MTKYYHIIKKQGAWHLYAGNAISALSSDVEQANVVRAARALARHDGARVVVHKDHSAEAAGHSVPTLAIAIESRSDQTQSA